MITNLLLNVGGWASSLTVWLTPALCPQPDASQPSHHPAILQIKDIKQQILKGFRIWDGKDTF